MKQVFGLVMNVAKGDKVIKTVVKRIEEGEDFAQLIHLEKDTAYVFGTKVVEGVSFNGNNREMIVWTAGRFEDEERQVSLWAVAQDDGEHELQVRVKWVGNKAKTAGLDMELVFVGLREGGISDRRLSGCSLAAGELDARYHRNSGGQLPGSP